MPPQPPVLKRSVVLTQLTGYCSPTFGEYAPQSNYNRAHTVGLSGSKKQELCKLPVQAA